MGLNPDSASLTACVALGELLQCFDFMPLGVHHTAGAIVRINETPLHVKCVTWCDCGIWPVLSPRGSVKRKALD